MIVGTAGHIDHGKTALVKALTGVDADRLPEEKQRGITIDLGFAEMEAGQVRFGFVDVPGHERFVKNMLAGASGIDLVMLVIAADEGVMPQTREHFDICRLLRIKGGIIVLTKTDVADAETIELARLEAVELVEGSFLEGSPVFTVSSRTGEGIEELRQGLVREAESIRRETDNRETRLPIDRSFSVRGFGAVVTGTLASGVIGAGDELELLPVMRKLRVRGVQTHGRGVDSAGAGQRTAVNLAGVDHHEISRGMVLTRSGGLTSTLVFDAEVEVLRDAPRALRSRQRVRIHLETSEVLARVAILNDERAIEPGSQGFAQFRLEAPVAAAHSDRFIIRSYSPQQTIAGGRILDPLAARHRRNELEQVLGILSDLAAAADGEGNVAGVFVRMAGARGMSADELRSRIARSPDAVKRLAEEARTAGTIVDANGILVAKAAFEALQRDSLNAIEDHHRSDKLSRGLQRETLREQLFKHIRPEIFHAVTAVLERSGKIALEQDVIRLATHSAELSPSEQEISDRLIEIYRTAGLEVPKLDEALREAAADSKLDERTARKVFQLFVNRGELIGVTNDYYFSSELIGDLAEKLRGEARSSGDPMIDVPKFKAIAGVSRKYAIPLLEYFDRTRVTVRVGDKRKVL